MKIHDLQGLKNTGTQEELRAELSTLKLSQLRKRAADAEFHVEDIEAAMDSATPTEAVIQLLVSAQNDQNNAAARGSDIASAAEAAHRERLAALKAELQRLGLSALQRRAASDGVEAAAVDAAVDGENAKEELVKLIMAQCVQELSQSGLPERPNHRLASLRPKELRMMAARAGATEAEVDAAMDSEDVRSALIELVGRHEARAGARRKQELHELKFSELKHRAAKSGAEVALNV
eukprot:SAG31_NODE_1044_length_10180_cov_64.820157_1_plen_235_part_00